MSITWNFFGERQCYEGTQLWDRVSSRLLAWVGITARLIPAPGAHDDILVTVAAITMMSSCALAALYQCQKICLRGVHNEIHNTQKPIEALPSQVF